MDKLTIRELAPYLPYNITCYANAKHFGLTKPLKACMDVFMMLNMIKGDSGFKIALYPLTSIVKEIEVNGERFVPFEKLEELMPNAQNYNWLRSGYSHKDLRDTIMEYSVIDKLCEWNFDCFNLIERGFAIDKTTLNP